jgi:hypothetical protein
MSAAEEIHMKKSNNHPREGRSEDLRPAKLVEFEAASYNDLAHKSARLREPVRTSPEACSASPARRCVDCGCPMDPTPALVCSTCTARYGRDLMTILATGDILGRGAA